MSTYLVMREPTPEELSRVLEVADIRATVIVSALALGGFRIGTLTRLRYYHVKEDLERGVTPVHVQAEITKGKYGDYDTFPQPRGRGLPTPLL